MPLTFWEPPSSYQTSIVLRVSSAPLASYDRTCTRSIPGVRPSTFPAFEIDQTPFVGVIVAATPFTFTPAVTAASDDPLNVTDVGLVVFGNPPVIGRLVATVSVGGGATVPPAYWICHFISGVYASRMRDSKPVNSKPPRLRPRVISPPIRLAPRPS